jgi:hypothetical protein
MAGRRVLVAFMLALCITFSMAQSIDPAALAAISAACGSAMPLLIQYGPGCIKAAGKPMKKCPPACANLIKSVPNAACSSAVFNATPAASRAKVSKVCGQLAENTL